jgi:hypothetical protein
MPAATSFGINVTDPGAGQARPLNVTRPLTGTVGIPLPLPHPTSAMIESAMATRKCDGIDASFFIGSIENFGGCLASRFIA